MKCAYAFGMIDEKMAERIVTELETGEIDTLWLCSERGSLSAALAIGAAISRHKVRVIATGAVAGAGLVILVAGAERLATPMTLFRADALPRNTKWETAIREAAITFVSTHMLLSASEAERLFFTDRAFSSFIAFCDDVIEDYFPASVEGKAFADALKSCVIGTKDKHTLDSGIQRM